MRILMLISAIFVLSLSSFGQSIYKSWYCENSEDVCLEINEKGFSKVFELDYMKIKKKKDIVKIKFCYKRAFLGWGLVTYNYKIEKLTEDTLVLSKGKQKKPFEHIYADTTFFYSTPRSKQ